jgi:hypothetical protein
MTRYEVAEVVLQLDGSRLAFRIARPGWPGPLPARPAAWECPRCGLRAADGSPLPRCGRCGFWDTAS